MEEFIVGQRECSAQILPYLKRAQFLESFNYFLKIKLMHILKRSIVIFLIRSIFPILNFSLFG